MDDLISRQAAIEAIGALCSCTLDEEATWREIIGRIPSAQQERKTGTWRAFKIGECDLIECTACKVARPREEMPARNGGKIAWKYCPECGAKMEENT